MKLDQRFSVVASALASQDVLETPSDFASHMRQSVKHSKLKTHLEVSKGAWDWQGWLSGLNIRISGLTLRFPTRTRVTVGGLFAVLTFVPMSAASLVVVVVVVVVVVYHRFNQ